MLKARHSARGAALAVTMLTAVSHVAVCTGSAAAAPQPSYVSDGTAPVSAATFHTFDIEEVFSNFDGSQQFIELHESAGANGHYHFAGNQLRSGNNVFIYPTDLPDPATANRWVLIATAGFAALPGAVTPDYIIPDGFFEVTGDTLSIFETQTGELVDTFVFGGPQQDPCSCDGDVNNDGAVNITDGVCIATCRVGDCSCCLSSCDVNCDGVVDAGDVGDDIINDDSAWLCLFQDGSAAFCCPGPTGACCTGTVCDELEDEACATAGGEYLGDDTVCAVDTCAPPPPPTGACCVTFDCVDVTAEGCALAGGAYQGDGLACRAAICAPPPCTCDGDVDGSGLLQIQDWICILDCAGGDCSCCVNSCDLNCDGLVNDLDAGSDPSNDRESIFFCLFSGTSPDVCCATPPTGACCTGEVCDELGPDACADAAGNYLGDDTVCTVDTCAPPPPPTGACCSGEVCSEAEPDACLTAGGTYQGDNTVCTVDTCAPPRTGACCVTFDCVEATADDCATPGGAYQGDDTACTAGLCAPPPCTCDADVDGSGGLIMIQDWICIRECILGDCSCCVNSCDLNCDGLVNDLDAGPDPTVDDGSYFYCQWIGGSQEVCCAPPSTGVSRALAPNGACCNVEIGQCNDGVPEIDCAGIGLVWTASTVCSALSCLGAFLPVDGAHSLMSDGTTGLNSPTNFGGEIGSVNAAPPSIPTMSRASLVVLMLLFVTAAVAITRTRRHGISPST